MYASIAGARARAARVCGGRSREAPDDGTMTRRRHALTVGRPRDDADGDRDRARVIACERRPRTTTANDDRERRRRMTTANDDRERERRRRRRRRRRSVRARRLVSRDGRARAVYVYECTLTLYIAKITHTPSTCVCVCVPIHSVIYELQYTKRVSGVARVGSGACRASRTPKMVDISGQSSGFTYDPRTGTAGIDLSPSEGFHELKIKW